MKQAVHSLLKKRFLESKLYSDSFSERLKPRRETWVQEKLSEVPSGLTILDAGAGEQIYRKYCNHLNYISQDFAQYDGLGNGEGLQTGSWDISKIDIVSDITAIPLEDGTVDVVLCTAVFEHIPHPEKAVKEFARILKPNGILILTAPFSSQTHFAPYHYCTGFNKYWHEKILPIYGFRIQEITPAINYYDVLQTDVMRVVSLSRMYNGHELNSFQLFTVFMMGMLLNRLSKEENRTSEINSGGYFVKAVKI